MRSGKRTARKHLDGEDFLHGVLESDERHGVAGLEVDDPHAADALFEPLDQRDAAEDGGLADLRQADERQRSEEREAAGEAGQLGDGFVAARGQVDGPRLPSPLSRSQSWLRYQRGEWGIDSPRAIVSFESTSIRTPPLRLFARQPPGSFGFAQGGDVADAAVAHGQAVEVAAVAGEQRGR